MIYINNTIADWQNIYTMPGYEDGIINVTINGTDDNVDDITNLKYFFPYANYLMTKYYTKINKLTLNIIFASKVEKEKTVKNIKSFLFIAARYGLYNITIDGKRIDTSAENWSFNNLFPMLSFKKKAKSVKGFKMSPISRYSDYVIHTFGSDDEPLAEDMLEDLYFIIKDKISFPDIYIGTIEASLSKEKKISLAQKMIHLIDQWENQMDVLSRLIWLYIMYSLIEEKSLFKFVSDDASNTRIEIDEAAVSKARFDACCYGEALFQIIENSCLHSCGKQSWVGFRLHKAGKNPTMSQLFQETRTRVQLYEKYKDCFYVNEKTSSDNIFNETYRYFFEMFAIDDASNKQGIVYNYNYENVIKPKYYTLLKQSSKSESFINAAESEATKHLVAEKAEKIAIKQKDTNGYIDNLYQLVDRKSLKDSDCSDESKYISQYISHYGIRLLKSIVDSNNGYIMCKTPNKGQGDTCYYYYNNYKSNNPKLLDNCDQRVTEWQMIVPISNVWTDMDFSKPANASSPTNGIFGTAIEAARTNYIYISLDDIIYNDLPYYSAKEKIEKINMISDRIAAKAYPNCIFDLNDSILHIDAVKCSSCSLELLAKAIVCVVINAQKKSKRIYDSTTKGCIHSNTSNLRIRAALVLSDVDAANEFVRLYSTAYIDNELPEMDGVQIAVCSTDKLGNNTVDYILAGKNLSAVFKSAISSSYYDSAHTFSCLPVLNYIARRIVKETTTDDMIPALFPFELYLKTGDHASDEKSQHHSINPWMDTWFIKRTSDILNREMQSNAYGCTINNIHIRIGSKIHLEKFVEGQLLFHDSYNVDRFAYLVAYDLLLGSRALDGHSAVLLAGYKAYSAHFIEQIAFWLRHAMGYSNEGLVHTAIIRDGDKEGDVYVELMSDKSEFSKPRIETVNVITLLPIDTTLNIIYKMHDALKMTYSNELRNADYSRNYCLILINDDLENGVSDLSEVTKLYWSNHSRRSRTVEIAPDGKCNKDSERKVKYLLNIASTWHNAQECTQSIDKILSNCMPLIAVSKSDITPSSIFKLFNRRSGYLCDLMSESQFDYNDQRILELYGNIWYSHIFDGGNHYQFYIEFAKFYLENREEIQNYMSKKISINRSPFIYNIIVSPLMTSNSLFIQDLIRIVFNGNVRFIHIDLLKSFREEARTALSYVSKEIKDLRLENPNAKINIYYADTSIVMGNTFNRAKLLVKMLISEAKISFDNISIFEKVFLLVNRSSYDTAHTFVDNPKENLCAYIHLSMPSYNTEDGKCPACHLVSKYDLLRKRSSTERISGVFRHLKYKHQKRTLRNYKSWLDDEILNSPTYFLWFKQWMFTNVAVEKDFQGVYHCTNILSFIPSENKKRIENNDESYGSDKKAISELYNAFINLGTEPCSYESIKEYASDDYSETNGKITTIAEVLKQMKSKTICAEDVLRLVKLYMISERNFMRLYCMHKSYQQLDYTACKMSLGKGLTQKKFYIAFRKTMLCILSQAVSEPPAEMYGSTLSDAFKFSYKVEWLLSYIKVLSREHIVSDYAYKQAIVNILLDLAYMVSTSKKLEKAAEQLIEDDECWKPIAKLMSKMHESRNDLDNDRGDKTEYDLIMLFAHVQYQLNMTIFHRLSDLQVHICLDSKRIKESINGYNRLKDIYDEALKKIDDKKSVLLSFPSREEAINRYMKSIKSASMTTDDDIPCFKLANTSKELFECAILTPEVNSVQILANYIYLENCRMLYSGMNELNKIIANDCQETITSHLPAQDFDEYMANVNNEIIKIISRAYKNSKDMKATEILRQNSLASFCDFWHKSSDGKPPIDTGKQVNELTYMYQYFNVLMSLHKQDDNVGTNEELPYKYEELCRTVCGMTDAKMSYLVYGSSDTTPEIIAQSGYYVPYIDNDNYIIDPYDLKRILNIINNSENDGVVNTVVHGIYKLTYQNKGLLVIEIPHFSDQTQVKTKNFYVVIQRDEPYKDNEHLIPLRHARNVLFLREVLQDVLSRHYIILSGYRHDCSYVRRIKAEVSTGRPQKVNILHISDIHMCQKLHDDIDNVKATVLADIKETLKSDGKSKNENDIKKIDLLAITGDIADCRESDVMHLRENYRYAEELLNSIIKELWSCNDYLPSDWKQRVLITTGNHDYATMNQFKSMLSKRAISVGTPVEGDAGTMASFTYFIEFLVKYLDLPIDELLKNDLNISRFYRALNIRVLIINGSGSATARRTNKVGPNYELLEEMMGTSLWKSGSDKNPFNLCLSHYSPSYNLSYFGDSYGYLPGWKWSLPEQSNSAINDFTSNFLESIKESMDNTLTCLDTSGSEEAEFKHESFSKLAEEYDYLTEAIKELENGGSSQNAKVNKYFKQLEALTEKRYGGTDLGKCRKAVLYIKRNPLFDEISYYVENLRRKALDESYTYRNDAFPCNDERISKLIYHIHEAIVMSKADETKYQNFFTVKTDNGKKARFDLVLAGHIHSYDESGNNLVSGMMYDQDSSSVSGYVIEIDKKASKPYNYTRLKNRKNER